MITRSGQWANVENVCLFHEMPALDPLNGRGEENIGKIFLLHHSEILSHLDLTYIKWNKICITSPQNIKATWNFRINKNNINLH